MNTQTLLSCCLSAVSLFLLTEAKVQPDHCEVCIKFLQKFYDSLPGDVQSSAPAIEESLKDYCKTTKDKDERFCYYIGALETSATSMLGDVTKPLSWSMPIVKVCDKVAKNNKQVCDLRYEKIIDLATTDLNKLKVKELKKILSDWNESGACKGCAEKSDYIRIVKELMPKYAPEAARIRNDEL